MAAEIKSLFAGIPNLEDAINGITKKTLLIPDQKKALYQNYELIELVYLAVQRKEGNKEEKLRLARTLHYICSATMLVLEHRQPSIEKELASYKGSSTVEEKTPAEKRLRLQKPSSHRLRTEVFGQLNWCRLLIIRLKRGADASILLKNMSFFSTTASVFKVIYKYGQFAFLSVAFYLFRLLPNLYLVLKHTLFPGADAKDIAWTQRLTSQYRRRSNSINNDLVWAGIDLAALLVKHTVAMTLIGVLYAFDVVNAIADYINLQLMTKELRLTLKGNIDIGYKKEILAEIQGRQNEKKFSIAITVLLLIGMVPVVSFVPQIPAMLFAGCLLTIFTTLMQKAVPRFLPGLFRQKVQPGKPGPLNLNSITQAPGA